jgi:hypothetical protein
MIIYAVCLLLLPLSSLQAGSLGIQDNCTEMFASYVLRLHHQWQNVYVFDLFMNDGELYIDFFDESLNNLVISVPYRSADCDELYTKTIGELLKDRPVTLRKRNCFSVRDVMVPIDEQSYRELKDLKLPPIISSKVPEFPLRRKDSDTLNDMDMKCFSDFKGGIDLNVLIDKDTGRIRDCYGWSADSPGVTKDNFIRLIYFMKQMSYEVKAQENVQTSIRLVFKSQQ